MSSPRGTDYVSSVDDYIRQTRQQLIDSLRVISGYPDISTVCIAKWNESTKPPHQSQWDEKVLIGFNSDLGTIEVISSSGNTMGFEKAIALLAHPVGSYYETSDTSFNPNTAWGGTWVEDTQARVLISRGKKDNDSPTFTAGDTGGEETHALTRPELPIHYHPHRHPHEHDTTGSFIQRIASGETATGYIPNTASTGSIPVKVISAVRTELPEKEDYAYSMKQVSNADEGWFALGDPTYTLHGMVDADTPKPNDSRTVSEDLLMHVGSAVGQNGHNNMQPYKVIVRWHRTA